MVVDETAPAIDAALVNIDILPKTYGPTGTDPGATLDVNFDDASGLTLLEYAVSDNSGATVDDVKLIDPFIEECDDGNTDDGDGCSADCILE